MIDYHTFHQIHHLHIVEHLNQAQIAAELQLDEDTVAKWLHTEQYRPCQMPACAARQTGPNVPANSTPTKARSCSCWSAIGTPAPNC